MKKITLIIMLFNSLILFAQTPPNDSHWSLVWADEFNTLNTNIWDIKDEFDHWGGELQVYLDDNVQVNNGILEITCKDANYYCSPPNVNF